MLRQWVVKSRPFSKLHMYAETMGGQKPPQSLPKAFQKLPQTVFKTKVERGLQAQVPRCSPLPLRRGNLQIPSLGPGIYALP